MNEPQGSPAPRDEVPWVQRLFDNIWLLAALAMLYFFLSYVLWGLLNLHNTPAAG